jgi:ribosome-binding protein aMBF1 (putative translation factor)
MDDLDRYLERRTAHDAEFRKDWESGRVELAFRKAIIGARLAAGLSQGQLAQRIGASESLLTRLEVGAARPRLEALLKVAAALDVTFEIDATGIRVREPA